MSALDGVEVLRVQGDVAGAVEIWRATQPDAVNRAKERGLVVICGQSVGARGFSDLLGVGSCVPAIALVVCQGDLPHARGLAIESAERGLIRQSFTCHLRAQAWVSARAKAIYRARLQPRLEPELLTHMRARA